MAVANCSRKIGVAHGGSGVRGCLFLSLVQEGERCQGEQGGANKDEPPTVYTIFDARVTKYGINIALIYNLYIECIIHLYSI